MLLTTLPFVRSYGAVQRLTGRALRDYLETLTRNEASQVVEAWRTRTSHKDLIRFDRYHFDPETLDYMQTAANGKQRRVSASVIGRDAVRLAIGAREQMRSISKQIVAGQIPLQQWYDDMAHAMKIHYYAAVTAARGEEPNKPLRAAEIAFLLWLLTRQFDFLDEFLTELEQGRQPLNGAFVQRAGMYGSATKSVFENWRLWLAQMGGWTEAARILGHADHCHDSKSRPGCVELAARGWIPIGQMTPLGEATCLTSCYCSIVYRSRMRLLAMPQPVGFSVNQAQQKQDGLVVVRDEHGHLLFKYDPVNNIVHAKRSGVKNVKPFIVELNKYR